MKEGAIIILAGIGLYSLAMVTTLASKVIIIGGIAIIGASLLMKRNDQLSNQANVQRIG